ncbi:MAG: hypothetical protein IRY91_14350 [Gemmatimonadaceae bacterium]|nr:hypothetical protein [Gemmatimonadaceae bacterium]
MHVDRLSAALLAAAAVLWSAPAAAQTRFAWPDTAVDVSQYTTVEDCTAAVVRVREGLTRHRRRTVWRDTLPWNPREPMDSLPAPLVETAQRCTARFRAASVPLADYALVLPLFLTAGRDADAGVLVSRRLAALDASRSTKADAERAAVMDTIFRVYLEARPARVAAAESLAVRLRRTTARPLRADPAIHLLDMYMQLVYRARLVEDTALMRTRAAEVVALLDSIPAAERPAIEDKIGVAQFNLLAYSALAARTGWQAALDSLRKSTAAFIALQQSLWMKASGERPDALGFPIGKRAPVLAGDFRFGPDSASPQIPVPGKVNLIVFLGDMCMEVTPESHFPPTDACLPTMATLRRLAARFPSLAITAVDHTYGYYMYLPPPAPADEAQLMWKSLAAHRMPGSLVVSTTPFWRLPAPDRRRIDSEKIPNDTPYSFGKSWAITAGAAFLIDREGIIVYPTGSITRESEHQVSDIIEILLEREHASR